ncbi:putative wing apart-like protein [Helianthus debilis subsp. tardiflorus]
MSQSQKSNSAVEEVEDEESKFDLMMMSQQNSTNVEPPHDSSLASCSYVNDDEKFSLLADCLLAAMKVLMNLTNDSYVGCEQIAACGGLETLCGLIVGHYPSFNSHLPNFDDRKTNQSLRLITMKINALMIRNWIFSSQYLDCLLIWSRRMGITEHVLHTYSSID